MSVYKTLSYGPPLPHVCTVPHPYYSCCIDCALL